MGMTSPATKHAFKAGLALLASPAAVFFLLPWLMILLTLGTVAQKEVGIFAAQKLFFSSWILWLGPVPLPGAYLTLGALTLCLLVKFLFDSPWRTERAGTVISHLGVLVLLIGGLITAVSQTEGFLLMKEGGTGQSISDYHARVLDVRKDDKPFAAIPFAMLKEGQKVDAAALPFTVKVETVCRNCRPAPVKDTADRKGLARQMSLFPAPLEKEDETNLAGAAFTVTGLPDAQDGQYVTLEEIPLKPTVTMDGHSYSFHMEREQRPLPFSVKLVKFTRDMHPGTDIARGFSSAVIVHDQGIDWPYTIRMNEPLRYKGYTFYQASFSERPDGEYSILSVVRNKGRIFPYVASFLIFTGLMLHVLLRLMRGRS